MTSAVVNIARDFSRAPAGRYVTDGPYSGEAFREQILHPAFVEHDQVQVELDGALGFGSSFLEEAFGGLVRVHGVSPEAMHRKIRIVSRIKTYEDRIWRYVDDARPNVRK